MWVQFGAFGPRVVEQTDEGWQLPPPGHLVDNESSMNVTPSTAPTGVSRLGSGVKPAAAAATSSSGPSAAVTSHGCDQTRSPCGPASSAWKLSSRRS